MGPGPSEVHPDVLKAMSVPPLGHLDPAFIAIMDETMAALRDVFATANPMTLPISGTGSAGMETAVVNLLEPGDRIVVGVCGYFGDRLAEIARRHRAEVEVVEAPWGRPVDPGDLDRALARKPASVLAVVHGETSTGILQPLEPVAAVARKHGAMLLVDTVCTLGGVPVRVDDLGIDLAYSGSQKCLSAPPGLAPVTASARAVERMRARKQPPGSWYLDLRLLDKYWSGEQRAYHHTAPISMIYSLREALRLALEEGLEARYERHRRAYEALIAGLPSLGMEPAVAEAGHRLPVLTAVKVPAGVDEKALRKRLLEEEGIEVAGGLGPFAGKILRIGLMGHGARQENVERLLSALGRLMSR